MFDKEFLVVELANILAGPTTTMAFAELGARVIKVENPSTSGDATRGWKLATEKRDADISAYFACANWGKESIAVDFAQEAGRQVVHDLIKHADIVIASFKPGDDKKLGLDYKTAKALNPAVIYGQINAYGADDPRPGFDAILQAEAEKIDEYLCPNCEPNSAFNFPASKELSQEDVEHIKRVIKQIGVRSLIVLHNCYK